MKWAYEGSMQKHVVLAKREKKTTEKIKILRPIGLKFGPPLISRQTRGDAMSI